MSIISVTRDDTRSGFGQSVNAFTYEGDFTEYYTVEFSSDTDSRSMPFLAPFAQGVPQLNTVHPASPWLFVVDHKTKWITAFMQEVGVIYRFIEDPLLQPPKISYGFASANEQVDRDALGNPIMNSSEETFDPPSSRDVDDAVIRITRNTDTFNIWTAASYKNTTNSDIVWGVPPGYLMLKDWSATYERSGNKYYFAESMEFHVRYAAVFSGGQWTAFGWKLRRVDEGYRIKTGVDSNNKPTYQTILDEDGKMLSQPTLLDGAGGKLASGANPVYKTFDLYPTRAYAALNLPYNGA